MGSQIVTQSGSELLSGFVFTRRREPLRRSARRCTPTGPTRATITIASPLTLHTRAGDVEISGRVLTMLPLRNRRDGKVTRISEGLTEWRCGDHVGYGWSEYLDQIA